MQKLSMSIDEFVKNTPYISEDGAVTLGSKKTTVFEVDLRTGKLIRTYRFNSQSTLRSDDEKQSVLYKDISSKELVKPGSKSPDIVDLRLHITRTDYLLTSFARDSDKTLWNMTIAEIGASLLCLDPSSGASLNFLDKLGLEIGIDFALPLSCHTRGPIFCHRSHILLESSEIEMLTGAHLGDMLLPMPPSGLIIPIKPKVDRLVDDSDTMLQLPPREIDDTGIVEVHGTKFSLSHMLIMFREWSSAFSIIMFLIILVVGLVVKGCVLFLKEKVSLNELPYNSSSKAASLKRKKNNKSANNDDVEKKDNYAHIDGENKTLLHINKLLDGGSNGRKIGKLFVSNTEIAKGSNGTIILEGIYEG